MRQALLLLLAVVVCMGAMGCYVAPVKPPVGWVFSEIQAPLDPTLEKTTLGGKMGEAKTVCYVGMVTIGDCSVKAAADSKGITTINHADYEYKNVLGIYQEFTVRVYGD